MAKANKASKGNLKITCGSIELHDIDELQEFQGNLKELYKDNAEKLWRQMLKNGFADPFLIWENDGRLNIISGHQRKRVLSIRREEGWEIPKVPCIPVQCADTKTAKELILACISQYGKVTDEGLYEFMVENELDPDLLKLDFDLPNLDVDYFLDGYFGEGGEGNPLDKGNNKNNPPGSKGKNITCPNCGHVFDPTMENCKD